MKIQDVKVKDIKGYAKNAKKHPAEQVQAVANSIKQFGFKQPLVLDKDNVVIIGHGRLAAAKLLGYEDVPCVMADDLTEEQVKALRLADNKTNESEWDFDLLGEELDSILNIDMSDFGFEIDDVDFEDTEIIEDEVPEEVETRCKLGDVWQLGEHRLICGDSTDIGVIDRLMAGDKADMVLTDPPYGIGVDKGIKTTYGTNAHNAYDYEGDWDDKVPDKDVFDMMLMLAGKAIIFGANYFTDKLPCNGAWIVWDKVGEIDFHNPFSDCELAWTNFDKDIVKKYTCIQQGFVADEKERRVHPTQKTVKLFSEILTECSADGDFILDFYGGSGTTLIACEQTGRRCYMCELDEHYCDVIIQRWEDFTGQKAVKL